MPVKLKRRRLRCSFCGKPESKVVKLLGGPRVTICDFLRRHQQPDPGSRPLSLRGLGLDGRCAIMRNLLQQQVETLR